MKLHAGMMRPNRYGGFNNNSLCGRTSRASCDGMNIAPTDEEVTCKFCLNLMASSASRAKRAES